MLSLYDVYYGPLLRKTGKFMGCQVIDRWIKEDVVCCSSREKKFSEHKKEFKGGTWQHVWSI